MNVVKDFYDFSGGFCNNIPEEQMADNELIKADGCFWENGLKKMHNPSTITNLGADIEVTGMCEMRVVDAGVTAGYADYVITHNYKLGSSYGYFTYSFSPATMTQTTIAMASGTAYTWGGRVETSMCEFGKYVVACDGVSNTAIIYPNGTGIAVMGLETFDERERANDTWYYGYWTGSTYTDDTTDAQDTGASQDATYSPSGATTGNGGFWCACDFTFSKMSFNSLNAASVTVTNLILEYYNGSTWTACTLEREPTWGSATTAVLEWKIPISNGAVLWQPFDVTTGYTSDFYGRYVVRGELYTSGATMGNGAFAYASVTHTHYLSQILGNEVPHCVTAHKNTLFLAAGNQIQIGVANSVKDWRSDRFEYFPKGGNKVEAMKTFKDRLMVIKENGVYSISGDSWANWSTSEDVDKIGSENINGSIVWDNLLVLANSTGVYVYDGSSIKCISRHIDWTTTWGASGDIWGNITTMLFKKGVILNTGGGLYYIDLSQLRQVNNDDYRASFYKLALSLQFGCGFFSRSADAYLITRSPYPVSGSGMELCRWDEELSTGSKYFTIDNFSFKTKQINLAKMGEHSHYTRIVPKTEVVDISDTSYATSTCTYNFTMANDSVNNIEATSTSVVSRAGNTAGGIFKIPNDHYEILSIPYTMDGRSISIEVNAADYMPMLFYGFSIESTKKRRL